MASGAVDVAPLISAATSLDEAPAWFERLYAREPGLMKVVVTAHLAHRSVTGG